MLIKLTNILSFVLFLGLFVSCKPKKNALDVSNVPVNIKVRRMENELFSCKTKADIQQFLQKNEAFVHQFYQTTSSDTTLINRIYLIVQHPSLASLHQQTESTFGDLADLTQQFKVAFQHIKYYYPAFKEPQIITTFTAFDKDLFISDSMIVISLENFIGKKALYRPNLPSYILKRYYPNYIVPTVVKFLSNHYNHTDPNDVTMLADMIFYGKAYEFTKTMMPNAADSLILGYTEKQLSDTWNAQDLVYAHFVDHKLLYETNDLSKEKYLGERPITSEVGKECPGRIGQWLGWRIVTRYQNENPSISLPELMKNNNARQIFEQSNYKGQIDKE